MMDQEGKRGPNVPEKAGASNVPEKDIGKANVPEKRSAEDYVPERVSLSKTAAVSRSSVPEKRIAGEGVFLSNYGRDFRFTAHQPVATTIYQILQQEGSPLSFADLAFELKQAGWKNYAPCSDDEVVRRLTTNEVLSRYYGFAHKQ